LGLPSQKPIDVDQRRHRLAIASGEGEAPLLGGLDGSLIQPSVPAMGFCAVANGSR
jgi:hypothetical protein